MLTKLCPTAVLVTVLSILFGNTQAKIPTFVPFKNFTVGASPVNIFFNPEGTGESSIYVLCAGHDKNKDGSVDGDDTMASIWKFNINSEDNPVRVTDIEDSFPILPFRSRTATSSLLIPLLNNTVAEFDMTTETMLSQSPYQGEILAVFNGGTEYIAILETRLSGKSSIILALGSAPLVIEVSDYAQQMLIFEKANQVYVSTLNLNPELGDWYCEFGPLVIDSDTYKWESDVVELGGEAGHLFVNESSDSGEGPTQVYVTRKDSSDVVVIDITQEQVVKSFSLESSGESKPDKGVFLDKDLLAITSETGGIFVVQPSTGEVLELLSEGTTTDLIGDSGGFIFTNTFHKDAENPEYLIGSFFSPSSAAQGRDVPQTITISPNIITDYSNLTSQSVISELKIYSSNGTMVYSEHPNNSEVMLEREMFPTSGIYYLEIDGTTKIVAVR